MTLRVKINVASLSILLLVTIALAISGVLTINSISYDLNRKLMDKDVAHLMEAIDNAIHVLQRSGVEKVERYQEQAEKEVLSEFEASAFGKTGRLIIVRKSDGTVLLNAPQNDKDLAFLSELAPTGHGSLTHGYADKSHFFYFNSHDQWDWLLILTEKTETLMELRRQFVTLVVFIVLAGFGVGTGLLLWSTNKIVYPIRLLEKAADAISQGRWQTELPKVQGNDEVANLTRSFSSMSDNLFATYQHLNEQLDKVQLAQNALFAEKERLSITLSSIGDGVICTDISGKITLINHIAVELTGWKQQDALGQQLEDVFQQVQPSSQTQDADSIVATIMSQKQEDFSEQLTLHSQAGIERIVSVSGASAHDVDGNPFGVILVIRDMTEYLKMQEDLLKTQKLESLGILAGGLAHDFNNIMTSILGNLSLSKRQIGNPDRLPLLLGDAEKAAIRAQGLTKQLLTFSKGGEPIKELVNLDSTIKETVHFALSGSSIVPIFKIAHGLWSAEVDAGQISQVIHNLVLNAAQAMPKGGNISICADNLCVTETDSVSVAPGSYIRVEISDEGCGIEKDILTRIFDPYFSMKDGGSGLGLASTYSIIDKHFGTIEVESQVDVGTTFSFYLPAQKQRISDRGQHQQQELHQGNGRILILDDEPTIRAMMGDMLEELGYLSDQAADGENAVSKYREQLAKGCRYEVVIMDLTIPGGMGGEDAIAILSEIDPAVKAIVSSGYSNNPIMSDYRKHGFTSLLPKPFTMEQLSAALDASELTPTAHEPSV